MLLKLVIEVISQSLGEAIMLLSLVTEVMSQSPPESMLLRFVTKVIFQCLVEDIRF